jgi:hypothetical protein
MKVLPFRQLPSIDVEIRLREIDRELEQLRGLFLISDEDLERKSDLIDERAALIENRKP